MIRDGGDLYRTEGQATGTVLTEAAKAADAQPFDKLTARQRQVARGLVRGQTCTEIAKHLGCSVKTVDTHRAAVLDRMDCSNTVKLTHLAIAWGEVEVMS